MIWLRYLRHWLSQDKHSIDHVIEIVTEYVANVDEKSLSIQVWSDLHLRFKQWNPRQLDASTDVLVLAGDIDMYQQHRNHEYAWDPFLSCIPRVASSQPIVSVHGNHDFYGRSIIDRVVTDMDQVHILDNTSVVINGVKWLGCTLWTHMNSTQMIVAQEGMNDYAYISDETRWKSLKAAETVRLHHKSVEWLRQELQDSMNRQIPAIVVSHHLPSYKSIDRKYINSPLNSAFASSLDDIIKQYDCVLIAWIHGHTHHSCDYFIGQTRVICNPKGYPGEQSGFDS